MIRIIRNGVKLCLPWTCTNRVLETSSPMSEPFTRYASVHALSYVNTNSTMADSVAPDGVLSVPRQEAPIETIRYVGIAFLDLRS